MQIAKELASEGTEFKTEIARIERLWCTERFKTEFSELRICFQEKLRQVHSRATEEEREKTLVSYNTYLDKLWRIKARWAGCYTRLVFTAGMNENYSS